jgi:hypothetical protein
MRINGLCSPDCNLMIFSRLWECDFCWLRNEKSADLRRLVRKTTNNKYITTEGKVKGKREERRILRGKADPLAGKRRPRTWEIQASKGSHNSISPRPDWGSKFSA